jgi:hypothetical protein
MDRTLRISKGAPAAQVKSVANPAAVSRTNSLPPASSSKKMELKDLRKSSVAPKPKMPNTTDGKKGCKLRHLGMNNPNEQIAELPEVRNVISAL